MSEPFVHSNDELVIPIKERKSLDQLEVADCHWPIGDPYAKDFHFCGRKRMATPKGRNEISYCEFHARRAFQPLQTRRREPVAA